MKFMFYARCVFTFSVYKQKFIRLQWVTRRGNSQLMKARGFPIRPAKARRLPVNKELYKRSNITTFYNYLNSVLGWKFKLFIFTIKVIIVIQSCSQHAHAYIYITSHLNIYNYCTQSNTITSDNRTTTVGRLLVGNLAPSQVYAFAQRTRIMVCFFL